MAERIRVEVALACPHQQWLLVLELPSDACVRDAVEAASIVAVAGLSEPLDVGIFGRRCTPATPLHDGDRVEIYRPLCFDPMESRRRRAAKARHS